MATMSDFPTDTPDEEHIATIVAETGLLPSEAALMLAMARGEVDGDIQYVD